MHLDYYYSSMLSFSLHATTYAVHHHIQLSHFVGPCMPLHKSNVKVWSIHVLRVCLLPTRILRLKDLDHKLLIPVLGLGDGNGGPRLSYNQCLANFLKADCGVIQLMKLEEVFLKQTGWHSESAVYVLSHRQATQPAPPLLTESRGAGLGTHADVTTHHGNLKRIKLIGVYK